MSRIDHGASRALDYIEETGQPPADSERRNQWTRFLLSLVYRSPSQVERLRRKIYAHRDESLQIVAQNYANLRGANDPDTFEEYLSKDNRGIEEESFASLMLKIMNSEQVGTALIRMTWGIMRFSQLQYGFLTCDIPIMLSNGLGHQDSFVMLPISPETIFIAAARKEVIDAFATQDAKVLERALNDVLVRQARQVVISREDAQYRFIDNRFLRSPPPPGELGLHTWKHPLIDLPAAAAQKR